MSENGTGMFMNELIAILDKIAELEESQTPYQLATLVNAEGSTYRDIGARILVWNSDEVLGTISGGCLEGDVCSSAAKMDNADKPILKTYDTTSEEDIYWGTGMGCGGMTTVLIDRPAESCIFLRMRLLLQQQKPFVLLTVFRSNNEKLLAGRCLWDGQKNLCSSHHLENLFDDELKNTFKSKRSSVLHLQKNDLQLAVLCEYVQPHQQLLLFGDGHDVPHVLRAASQLGWATHVISTKPSLADSSRFPTAQSVRAWENQKETLKSILSPRVACVIMTHNFLLDKEILQMLLPSDVSYIGFLGPKKRGKRLLEEALNEGLEVSDEKIARYFSPVGLDIGAETAGEIAVSIVGEVLSVLRHRNGGFLKNRQGAIHVRKATIS